VAAFNFPNSPSNNQTHTENGVTWKYDGTVWKRVESVGPTGPQGHQGRQGSAGAQGAQGNPNAFPSGTRLLFNQTTPPTGWTKDTSSTNRALRLVSGTVGTGGANTFTGQLNQSVTTSGGSVSNHTLTAAQIPSHRHWVSAANVDDRNGTGTWSNGQMHGLWADAGSYSANDPGHSYGRNTANTGGGSAHNHGFTQPSFNLNIAYTDVVIAQKD
tara:strand:- start:440 stop:1081 length:642 start_codon:yes stop_codon:yes gene_type:complete